MNKETALKTIEEYFRGRRTEAEYSQAVAFFAPSAGAASLRDALVNPGGLDCDEVRDVIPLYLDPLLRHEITGEVRERFLIHLANCVDCAEDYLTLSDFEGQQNRDPALAIPRFGVPNQLRLPALSLQLEKLLDSAKAFKVSFRFIPQSLAAPFPSRGTEVSPAEFSFIQPTGTKIITSVGAVLQPVGSNLVKLIVTLEGAGVSHVLAGHRVILKYNTITQAELTDEVGQVVFSQIPLSAVEELSVEISVSIS